MRAIKIRNGPVSFEVALIALHDKSGIRHVWLA